MKITQRITNVVLLALLLIPAVALAQEQPKKQEGMIDFGVRHVFGEVYGRPDLPFEPSLQTSKYNEYRDIRNGFFIRRFRFEADDILGTNNYVRLQSEKAIYKDQTYLATFGQWNRFKIQFRYDEIPHIFSNTARTVYSEVSPGVWSIPLFLRTQLQAINTSTSLPSTIQTQIVPGETFITPQLIRRSAGGTISYNFTPDWTIEGGFSREHQTGLRPLGQVLNSGPSASLTGGFGAEIPERIDYLNDVLRAATEYGRKDWNVRLGYLGSYFQNNVGQMTYDNPFRTTDCIAPTGCTTGSQGPAQGVVDLYPDNKAHYLNFGGAFGLGKHTRLMASATPGWLRQNDPFLPYTSNSLRLAQTAALPAASLNGEKQTLAMNYTVVTHPTKAFELKAMYRHYDYNSNTEEHDFTPVQGDSGAPGGPEDNHQMGYNRKTVELTGNWFFAKKSSVKFGYEGEWMDRKNRDVAHSRENTFVSALDWAFLKDLSLRVGYRHSARNPEEYEDELFSEISGGITVEQVNHRRFDEAARLRDRGDVQLVYDMTDRISFSGFANTVQDNYNRPGDTNTSTPLNFIPGNTTPYYLYGVINDLSYDWGGDATFSLTNDVSLFAEYSHERYNKRIASRYRAPGGTTPLPMDCSTSGRACDSPNNDWESTTKDVVDIFTIGTDSYFGKRVYFTTYYSLSAAVGDVFSRPLGDTTLLTGPNKFILTGTNAAVDYPQTVNRLHDFSAIVKFKLTQNFMPRFEYRFSRFDNKDYQTTPSSPYMGCVSPLPPSAAVPGCPALVIGTASPYYPYFVTGDPSAARYLFLGVDQPSYKSHYVAFTLEYHF